MARPEDRNSYRTSRSSSSYGQPRHTASSSSSSRSPLRSSGRYRELDLTYDSYSAQHRESRRTSQSHFEDASSGSYIPGEDFDLSYMDDSFDFESERMRSRAGSSSRGASNRSTRSASSYDRGVSRSSRQRDSRSSSYSDRSHDRVSQGNTPYGVSRFGIGDAFGAAASTVGDAVYRFRIPLIGIVVLILLVAAMAYSFNAGVERINQGVSIGSVDVSGKTAEEARALVIAAYNDKLVSTDVVIYADEEAAENVDIAEEVRQQEALAEQVSWEDDRQNRRFWVVDADSLGAELDLDGMVAEALSYGRDDEDPSKQITSAGYNVQVRALFNDDSFEELAESIDAAIGEPRTDNNIAIENNEAVLVSGVDGRLIDRDTLNNQLQTRFFSLSESAPYVAEAVEAPSRTTLEQAEAVRDRVNAALSRGATFTYKGSAYPIPVEHLAAGIATEIIETDEGWDLHPYFDVERMQANLVADIGSHTTSDYHIDFVKKGDDVTVKIDGEIEVPKITDAAAVLQKVLLDNESDATSPLSVTVETEIAPQEMPLDQAIDWGIVDRISRFTTQFVNSTSTENRTHNIKLAASILNNSIVEPGGTWSFNEVAGESSEERGYKGAGAIVNDEFQDEVGGGICQVATTVFNAVYSAGFPIEERHNHTLYIASYPAGRDAAIAYPYMDLKWSNDTDSDVLLACTTTDDSITVTLYGADPGYEVTSEAGEWEDGEKYEEVVEVDDELAAGTSYVKTAGSDGRRITVYRTVTGADGTVVRTDSFISVYSPVNEVIVKGPELPTINDIPTVPDQTGVNESA